MKKFLALLLAVVMVLSLVACSKAPATEDEKPAESKSEPAGEETAEVVTHPNRLIYGSTTECSGDIGPGAWWTNNATDKMIRDLINDYSVIVTNQGGEFVVNKTVASDVSSVENEDGTKTFTVKIKLIEYKG